MTVDRSKLLAAAARVYGEYGFRGATTRRIADEAGVNEITIFRQFGSKEALINEAIRSHTIRPWPPELPAVPECPEPELSTWCAAVLAHLSDARSVIRRMMSEMEERPDVGPCVGDGPTRAARHLLDYVGRLRGVGFLAPVRTAPHATTDGPGLGRDARSDRVPTPDGDAHAAVSMLMAALFADAMGRDMMPTMYPQPADRAVPAYVRLFLRALGVRSGPPSSTATPSPPGSPTP
jgi:AcrR family transcriptional regulator